MIRLRGAYRGGRAAVIFGGPSLVAQGVDFTRLTENGFTTFVETKALTPHLLRNGFTPDYHLLLFPEKAKDNALQHFAYRSVLAEYPIAPFLKEPFRPQARLLSERRDEFLETWRPHKGPHKRFRWRPDVYLPDSPFDLLARTSATKIIANRALVEQYFPAYPYDDRTFYFGQSPHADRFDLQQYFAPQPEGDTLRVGGGGAFLNSAAIVLYPLLHYMGFSEVYFLGMDMSMLGSLEYSAPYTFRSMAHFWWFFHRTRRVFNYSYRRNGWLFTRPQSEFDDLRMLWRDAPLRFVRVYDPWRYATVIEGIPTVSVDAFFTEVAA